MPSSKKRSLDGRILFTLISWRPYTSQKEKLIRRGKNRGSSDHTPRRAYIQDHLVNQLFSFGGRLIQLTTAMACLGTICMTMGQRLFPPNLMPFVDAQTLLSVSW